MQRTAMIAFLMDVIRGIFGGVVHRGNVNIAKENKNRNKHFDI